LVTLANDAATDARAGALAQNAVASFTVIPSTPLTLVAVKAGAGAVGVGVAEPPVAGVGVGAAVVVVVVKSVTERTWPYGISTLFMSTGTTITEAVPVGMDAPDNAKEYKPMWQQMVLNVPVVFCTVPNELPTFVP